MIRKLFRAALLIRKLFGAALLIRKLCNYLWNLRCQSTVSYIPENDYDKRKTTRSNHQKSEVAGKHQRWSLFLVKLQAFRTPILKNICKRLLLNSARKCIKCRQLWETSFGKWNLRSFYGIIIWLRLLLRIKMCSIAVVLFDLLKISWKQFFRLSVNWKTEVYSKSTKCVRKVNRNCTKL